MRGVVSGRRLLATSAARGLPDEDGMGVDIAVWLFVDIAR